MAPECRNMKEFLHVLSVLYKEMNLLENMLIVETYTVWVTWYSNYISLSSHM